ncbi:850_t:CDS:1, partial [Funneliformis geosporum]
RIMFASTRPSGIFGKDVTTHVKATALASQIAPILAFMSELSNTFYNS